MGTFDTLSGFVECQHCNEINHADISFKWLDPIMATYHIGDYVDGNDILSIIDSQETKCTACKQSFRYYAIGKYGYLYGFSNEIQTEKIKEIHSLNKNEDNLINITITKDMLMNIDNLLEILKEKLINLNNNQEIFIHPEISNKINNYINRKSALSKETTKNFNIGDSCWIDRKHRYKYDKDMLIEYKILKKEFNDDTQLYHFVLEDNEHNIKENIPEYYLIDKNKLDLHIQSLISIENQILELYNNPDNKDISKMRLLHLRIHGQNIVEKLKNEGKLPPDFVL